MKGGRPGTKKILAPAKLNIRLKVTGLRPDGYHELISIMVPVTLFDHLELEKNRHAKIVLACRGLSLSNSKENLVYKAARTFFSKTGIRPGISIKLVKKIPVAAGLGGGSSDAALTLKTLNSMWSGPLTTHELERLAAQLGADVPFFLHSSPCLARGIGEVLEPIKNWPGFQYVIVVPRFHISTLWVYENLKFELTADEYDSIIQQLETGDPDVINLLENDLESVTASYFPVIRDIKKHLMDTGATGALMSGSGPSVFGIFKSRDQALSAKNRLISLNLGDVFSVEGIVTSSQSRRLSENGLVARSSANFDGKGTRPKRP